MDIIKNIKLALENPANNLTTTTRDLLETTIVSLELEAEENKVSLTNEELVGLLQLINDCISERKCDENELGYMGLLNLKNKLQK